MKFKNKLLKKPSKSSLKSSDKIVKDNKGNFYIGIATILLISFLILSICILNLAIESSQENTESIANDEYEYIIQDYKRNIPIIEREAIEEISEEVISKKTPLDDSKEEIKKRCDEKLANLNEKFYNHYNIKITSYVSSIENISEPFDIRFKTCISSVKNNMNYEIIEEKDINIEGLKDPIPFLYCGKDLSFSYNETNVKYGNSLAKYLCIKE